MQDVPGFRSAGHTWKNNKQPKKNLGVQVKE